MRIPVFLLLAFLSIPSALMAETVAERSVLLVRQGAAALLRGKFESAISSYDRALEYDKLSPIRKASIHSDRGVARWRLQQPGLALADFNKAIELNAQYPQVYNNMGNVYMDQNNYEKALQAYSKAIEIAPTYGVAYNNRGSAYFELSKIDEAIIDFTLAVKFLALNAVPHNGRGRAFLSKGKNYAAMRDLSRAVKLNKTYGMVFLSRARAFAELGRSSEAIKDYTHAISLARLQPELYYERGKLYQKQGSHPPAIADFTKVIDLAPGHANAYALRGLSFGVLKKYEKAFSDADKSVELDPNGYLAFLSRGKIAKRQKEYENALDDFNTVLKVNAANAEAPKLIAQIYEIGKNKEEAINFYRRSLAADRFLSGSRAGLKRLTGTLPTYEGKLIGEQVAGWSLSQLPDGKYYIYNERYPYLYGFIETYGKGEPRLIQWTPMKGAWRGIGQLRYFAGMKGEGEQAVSLEYTALIDLKKARLVAIEPYQWGKKQAKWKWGNGSVTITDPDGMTSEVVLKKAAPLSLAAERRQGGRGSVSSPVGNRWAAAR
ncbi:MAG: tetratricopeptide repeat protein, partial [Hyphomicrobiaceae bacterium]|nr:tetratricopeptide repeat protein [Hyphomicrobiaceae bacterium]